MYARRLSIIAAALAASFVPLSCGDNTAAAVLPAVPKGLEKVTLVVPASNPLTAEKAALGKLLFFDPRLSSDGAMSCSTCHEHDKGWTDGVRFSKKVDGSMNTRNSPSLYNVGYQKEHYYWDGRAPDMESNVTAAWKGHMGGKPDEMAATIGKIPAYAERFKAAFGGAATGENIVFALCSFVRTLRSGGADLDLGKLSPAAKRGQELFTQRCLSCHLTPLFTDHRFHNVGVGEKPDVGRGKFDEKLPGAFKTPSLRSVSKTAPYFHDGSVATLREAVKIMAGAGIANPNLDPILVGFKNLPAVTDAQIDDLVAFLEALESKEPFDAPKLP